MRTNVIKCAVLSLFLLFLCCLYNGDAVAGNQKNFLWKIQSKTNTVYLLGSVHFMKKEIYPLNKGIEDAFSRSEVLVVEADVNNLIGLDIQKMMSAAFYSEGDSLDRHISGETFERVKREFDSLGVPSWIMSRQKPWFVALTLSSARLIKLGFDPTYGIDMHFLMKADGQKRVKELESINYQIDLLSGFSDSEQEAFLRYTLNDLNSLEKNIDLLITAWQNGDVRAMESVINQGFKDDRTAASVYEKLIYERNRTMAHTIEGFLKTSEPCFVIVGAGHLVGEKGIVELLKKRGYPVEQL